MSAPFKWRETLPTATQGKHYMDFSTHLYSAFCVPEKSELCAFGARLNLIFSISLSVAPC